MNKNKKCKKGYIINPKTGYCIKINGPTYKKLVQSGVLIPPIEQLPDEILIKILLEIPPNKLKSVCETNRRYARLCRDKQFREIYKQKYGTKDMNLINKMAKRFKVGFTNWEIINDNNFLIRFDESGIYRDKIDLKKLAGLGRWTTDHSSHAYELWTDLVWNHFDEQTQRGVLTDDEAEQAYDEYIAERYDEKSNDHLWVFENIGELEFELYEGIKLNNDIKQKLILKNK